MRRLAACFAVSIACAIAARAAVQDPPPRSQAPKPVFRAGVEIFHLDVSVLDHNRQPVRGLTAADFKVFEDGKPQNVVALSPVDIPDSVEPSAPWMRDIAPDVATNQLGDRRLFVIVMDDATIPNSPFALNSARRIGRDVVNRLGPSDLAAVVFARDNRHAQNFTNDHAKLLAAIEHYSPGFASPPRPPAPPEERLPDTELYFKQSSIDAVAEAARFLIEIPDRRKALVYITYGVAIDLFDLAPQRASLRGSMAAREGAITLQKRLVEIFRNAERANVNVYPFDICGLRPPAIISNDPCRQIATIDDFFQTVANGTGGRATVNTNDFTAGITQMFRENSSYYVVGYESASKKSAGSFRRVEVTVARPGVEVRARTRYYSEKPPPPPKAGRAPTSPVTAALAGLLPNPDMPLVASLAPFAIPGRADQSTVTIVLGVETPATVAASSAGPRGVAKMDLLVSAFDPEGRPRGSQKQAANLAERPEGDGRLRYELLARMDLKPGRYSFRLAAHDAVLDRTGSVYADVDIPDFAKAPLSLSGLLLSAAPGVPSVPREVLAPIVPIVPTAVRTFGQGDRVTAFLRVYQGGDVSRPPVPVGVAIRIRDTRDAAVADVVETLGPGHFGPARAADVRFGVPVARLAPGEYLLTIDARLSDRITARRDVRFTVK